MNTLFFSYSHKDESFRDELEVHLAMLIREGLIDAWHDRRILAGDYFDSAISMQMEAANIILLLISPDFLASRYCYDIEMERAMIRHKRNECRVIAIILRACDWRNTSFAKLLVTPTDGKPITRWLDRDEAFLDVVRHIRTALHSVSASALDKENKNRPPVDRQSLPTRSAYVKAVMHLCETSAAPMIQGSILMSTPLQPCFWPGGFSVVFKMMSGSDSYAIKCWTHDIGGAQRRYDSLSSHLESHPTSYFVGFVFLTKGIKIGSNWYPVLRIDWVDAPSLVDFIASCVHQNRTKDLIACAEAFRRMCESMMEHRFGNGDLNATDIRVISNDGEIDLKIVDYDAMVTPEIVGSRKAILGLPAYHHPKASDIPTSSLRDGWFSEVVIYTSLCALADEPALWLKFHRNDYSLIFDADDYCGKKPSLIFTRLYNLSVKVSRLAVILWNIVTELDADQIPGLKELIQLAELGENYGGNRARSQPFSKTINQRIISAQSGSSPWIDSERLLNANMFQ